MAGRTLEVRIAPTSKATYPGWPKTFIGNSEEDSILMLQSAAQLVCQSAQGLNDRNRHTFGPLSFVDGPDQRTQRAITAANDEMDWN